MRLFIAVPIPKEIRWVISSLVEELKEKMGNQKLRWVSDQNWHFTVTFLGSQEEEKVKIITEVMDRFLKGMKSFSVRLKEVGYGPSLRDPSMIWCTTHEETGVCFVRLKNLLEDELERTGIRWQRDRRGAGPHITLARFTGEKKISFFSEDVSDLSFDATGIELVQSTLSRSGPYYTTLHSSNFG